MNAELIKGLRWCADESICCDDFRGEKCPYFDEKKDSCSVDEILHDAADALEAADKRIEELMPKEGEWKKILQNGDGTSDYQCSACLGIIMDVPDDDEHPLCSFCPNCGARMKGEQE